MESPSLRSDFQHTLPGPGRWQSEDLPRPCAATAVESYDHRDVAKLRANGSRSNASEYSTSAHLAKPGTKAGAQSWNSDNEKPRRAENCALAQVTTRLHLQWPPLAIRN